MARPRVAGIETKCWFSNKDPRSSAHSGLTLSLERHFVWLRPQGLTMSLKRAHVSGHRPSDQLSLFDPFLFDYVVHGEMGESYDSSLSYSGYVTLLTKKA